MLCTEVLLSSRGSVWRRGASDIRLILHSALWLFLTLISFSCHGSDSYVLWPFTRASSLGSMPLTQGLPFKFYCDEEWVPRGRVFRTCVLLLLCSSTLRVSRVRSIYFCCFPTPIRAFPFIPLALCDVFRLLACVRVLRRGRPRD